MSPVDYRSIKLGKNEARKLITEIITRYPKNVVFTRHAVDELRNDDLDTGDALSLLKSPSSRILKEGEVKDGTYRYRLETARMCVVVAFRSETALTVVTVWRK